MANKPEGYHLSLSIGKALWDDLVSSTLPVKMAEGTYDLTRAVYQGVKRLEVKERVVALLEDKDAPEVVGQLRQRAGDMWQGRRDQIYGVIDDMVRIEGDWRIELDDETEFHYARQKIGVDARVSMVASGTATLLRNNVEIPFTIHKRLGAACHLGDIRYDKEVRAVVGSVQDPTLHLGEHVVLKMLSELAGLVLDQQVDRFDTVPILRRDQLEEMVSPAGGPLKVKMGIDDVVISVSDEDLTLSVRFGFEQLQLAEAEQE